MKRELPQADLLLTAVSDSKHYSGRPLPACSGAGCRTDRLYSEKIEEAGGPATYVENRLDVMAGSAESQAHEGSSRQLSLF